MSAPIAAAVPPKSEFLIYLMIAVVGLAGGAAVMSVCLLGAIALSRWMTG